MNENIAKPITLVKEEFNQQIIELVNSSQLPLFIVEYVLKDILNEVHVAANRQLKEDSIQYSKLLSEEKREENES